MWKRAQKVLHGTVTLLSKKPVRFLREGWPAYFKEAKGIEVIDLDGNSYLDFSFMGVGPNLLGYRDKDVNAAVKKVIDAGNQATLNSPEEIELAEELLRLHPWAGQVRYARTGGEIMSVAIRVARSHVGKDTVALCGYHGWHDWYLATNLSAEKALDGHLLPGLEPIGVPRALAGTALPFRYNHIEELEKLVAEHDIGVIAMEPQRHALPENDFLHKVREIADRVGAVLVFDEISSGFRLGFPGAHVPLGVTPDLVVYSKAMGGGYPMAALVGKTEIMKEAQASFISSTYHSERVGPAAALATLKKLKKLKVTQYVDKMGWKIGKTWERVGKKRNLPIHVEGPGAFINFTFKHPEVVALKALYTQQMLDEGYLASPIVYVSYAHKDSHLPQFEKAVDRVFAFLAERIAKNDIMAHLKGGLPEAGFKRLT